MEQLLKIKEQLKRDIRPDEIFNISGKTINSLSIRIDVFTEFGDPIKKTYIKMNDDLYFVPYKKYIQKIIQDWERKDYIREKFDCDNFAYLFKAYCMLTVKYEEEAEICIGRVSIEYGNQKHAINIISYIEDDNFVFKFFEPQTSEVFGLKELIEKYGNNVKIYYLEF